MQLDNKILIIGHHTNFPPIKKYGNKIIVKKLRSMLCDYLEGMGYDVKIIDSNAESLDIKKKIMKYKNIINFEETFDDRSMNRFSVDSLSQLFDIFDGKNVYPSSKFLYYNDSKTYYSDFSKQILPGSELIIIDKNGNVSELKTKIKNVISSCNPEWLIDNDTAKFRICFKFGFSGEKHGYHEYTDKYELVYQQNQYGDAVGEPEKKYYSKQSGGKKKTKIKINDENENENETINDNVIDNVNENIVDNIMISITKHILMYQEIIKTELPILIQPFNKSIADRANEYRLNIIDGIPANTFAKGKNIPHEAVDVNNEFHLQLISLGKWVWDKIKIKFPECIYLRVDMGYYMSNGIKKIYINEIENMDATMYFAEKDWKVDIELNYYQEILAQILGRIAYKWLNKFKLIDLKLDVPKEYTSKKTHKKKNEIISKIRYNGVFQFSEGKDPLGNDSIIMETTEDIKSNSFTWKLKCLKMYLNNKSNTIYVSDIKMGIFGNGAELIEFIKKFAGVYGFNKILLKDGATSPRNYRISASRFINNNKLYYEKYGFVPSNINDKSLINKRSDFINLKKLIDGLKKMLSILKDNKINKFISENNGDLYPMKNNEVDIKWICDTINTIIVYGNTHPEYVHKQLFDLTLSQNIMYQVVIKQNTIELYNKEMDNMRNFGRFIKNIIWEYTL